MIVVSYGICPKGRPKMILGLTPQDLFHVLSNGGIVTLEDPEEGEMPVVMSLMLGDSDEQLTERVQEAVDHIKNKDTPDADDDV